MSRIALAAYRRTLHQTLLTYRGCELTELARRAGISRASVYHLRSDPHANARSDTLEKLERALNQRS